MGKLSKSEAQKRADRITGLPEELALLEKEQVLFLALLIFKRLRSDEPQAREVTS